MGPPVGPGSRGSITSAGGNTNYMNFSHSQNDDGIFVKRGSSAGNINVSSRVSSNNDVRSEKIGLNSRRGRASSESAVPLGTITFKISALNENK